MHLPQARARPRGPGMTAAAAVLLAFALAALGALLDARLSGALGWGFRLLFLAGTLLAAVLVNTRGMRAVAVAPPLVYALTVVLFGLLGGGATARTPSAQLVHLGTELIFGAPVLVLATVSAGLLVFARARRS